MTADDSKLAKPASASPFLICSLPLLIRRLTIYEYRSPDTPSVVLHGVLEQRQKTCLARGRAETVKTSKTVQTVQTVNMGWSGQVVLLPVSGKRTLYQLFLPRLIL